MSHWKLVSVAPVVLIVGAGVSVANVQLSTTGPVPSRGDATFQQWTFDDDADWPPVPPETDENPYGTPNIDSDPSDTEYEWVSPYHGRIGVLHAYNGRDLIVSIPNSGFNPDRKKNLRLEMIYHEDGVPLLSWDPEFAPWRFDLGPLGDGWWHLIVRYHPLDFNPAQELLTLTSEEGTHIYLDEIEISTLCYSPGIPTVSEWGLVAMTLLVLTAGTLVFVRRREAA